LIHHTRETEITKLRVLVSVQKDVAWFQVPVQDPLRALLLGGILGLGLLTSVNRGGLGTSVAEVESGDDLGEDFPDELLLDMLLIAEAAFDNLLEVTTLAVLHDYVNFEVSLVDTAVVKAHDIGVLKVTQDVDLRYDLLLLFIVHFAVV